MSISEIADLPLREKFQIMEILWGDMQSSINDAEVPREHQDLLDTRRKRVEAGDAVLLDWDRVKNAVGRV